MRRVIAISLAILVLAVGARGVMAQDSEQQVSDRLLEILKDREIISEDEYSELKDLAVAMEQDRSQMDARLDDLDRSISEYLAQGGDARGANVSHKKGQGFGFSTGDGFFSLWIGGLFQTWYIGRDNDKDAVMNRDTNSISIVQNRFNFSGNAFDPNLTYFLQFNLTGTAVLLDAWVNWDFNGAQVRMGQMKVPYGRQWYNDPSTLQFGILSPITGVFTPGRDIGVMLWDAVEFKEGGEPMLDYYAGLFNGDGPNVAGNDNNWMAFLGRVAFHPIGYVDYTEGAREQEKFAFAIGVSYYYSQNRPATGPGTTQTVKTDNWGIDFALEVSGLYFAWEYFWNKTNLKGAPQFTNWGTYFQAGFMIPNSNFEIIGNYSFGSWDLDTGLDETQYWALGMAYYFDKHPFKIMVFFAQNDTDAGKRLPSTALTSVTGIGAAAGTPLEPVKTSFFNIAFQLDW